jgi:hypothetical protein
MRGVRLFQPSTVRAVLVALFLIGTVSSIEAATVRGRLVRRSGQGVFPAQGIPVTVFRSDLGRSGRSYSAQDGMYYLTNIPPGTYTLEVWVYPNRPPLNFTIQVNNQQFSDIAQIVVP